MRHSNNKIIECKERLKRKEIMLDQFQMTNIEQSEENMGPALVREYQIFAGTSKWP